MKLKKNDTMSIQKGLRNPPSERNPKELEESPLGEGHVNKDVARCSASALTDQHPEGDGTAAVRDTQGADHGEREECAREEQGSNPGTAPGHSPSDPRSEKAEKTGRHLPWPSTTAGRNGCSLRTTPGKCLSTSGNAAAQEFGRGSQQHCPPGARGQPPPGAPHQQAALTGTGWSQLLLSDSCC